MSSDRSTDMSIATAVLPPASFPAVGSMPLWEKLKHRVLARIGYGRYAAPELWRRAVESGNGTLADRLLAAGMVYPKPADKEAYDGLSELLFEAVRHLDGGAMTERLLSMGANPNHIHRNDYYDAPTHRAARARNAPALLAMIAHGANMNLCDGNRYTPMLAVLSSFGATTLANGKPAADVDERWAMVEACLAAGADPQAKGSHDQTLLTFALGDTPERVQWVLDLGLVVADPRQAMEDVFFSDLNRLGDHRAYVNDDGLAHDRFQADPDYRYRRDEILALLEQVGGSYAGVNEAGRTFIEEGIARHALRAEDVASLVARGATLESTDADGNTLTHQLLTQQRYGNDAGVALYDALRLAGLPDQRTVRNAAGLTPKEARDQAAEDWYVRQAKAFDHRLDTDPSPAPPTSEVPIQPAVAESIAAPVRSRLRSR
jgi:hypothetical protein